jgi:hypothetical protein
MGKRDANPDLMPSGRVARICTKGENRLNNEVTKEPRTEENRNLTEANGGRQSLHPHWDWEQSHRWRRFHGNYKEAKEERKAGSSGWKVIAVQAATVAKKYKMPR